MKIQNKILIFFLILMLSSFSLISCTTKNSPQEGKQIEDNKKSNPQPVPSTAKTEYKNGTYTGKSQITSTGQEEAVVTIMNGKISDITLKVLDTSGKEIDYSKYIGKDVDGTYYPNINYYRVSFADSIIQKQSTNVPNIPEIPDISANWKAAVNSALTEAKISQNK
ncbi:MAG: FMN-binding protein [Sarcina sp.]